MRTTLQNDKENLLIKDVEKGLAERKLRNEEKEMKASKRRYLSEKEALSKYR